MPQMPAFPEIPAPQPVGAVKMVNSDSFADVQLDIPITDGPYKASWASIEHNGMRVIYIRRNTRPIRTT